MAKIKYNLNELAPIKFLKEAGKFRQSWWMIHLVAHESGQFSQVGGVRQRSQDFKGLFVELDKIASVWLKCQQGYDRTVVAHFSIYMGWVKSASNP